jgi:hypothetical protein
LRNGEAHVPPMLQQEEGEDATLRNGEAHVPPMLQQEEGEDATLLVRDDSDETLFAMPSLPLPRQNVNLCFIFTILRLQKICTCTYRKWIQRSTDYFVGNMFACTHQMRMHGVIMTSSIVAVKFCIAYFTLYFRSLGFRCHNERSRCTTLQQTTQLKTRPV